MPALIAALVNAGLPLIAGAVQAKGKELIEDKLGVKLTPDLTPEQIATLKQKEIEHEEFLTNAAQKEFETEVADRTSARGMQIAALQGTDEFSKRFIYNLATGCLLFTAVYIFFITFIPIPAQNIRFTDTILGFLLGTLVSTIIYFFFGTSRNSVKKDDDKNELINKLLDK